MSQRIKLKFFPFPDMVADLVVNLAEAGFNIEMSPCEGGDFSVLIAERCYEGEEPMVLGSKLETLLNNLIEEISSSTVSTSLGQMPLLNATSIAKLKKDVKGILS